MRPVPRCPLAPGEPCTLCKLGATGPEDCPTVYLVMNDPDLRERLNELRRDLHDERSGSSVGSPHADRHLEP